jgi:O-antigen ligase/polysaccharide polymerase Wzy-like membrane protein
MPLARRVAYAPAALMLAAAACIAVGLESTQDPRMATAFAVGVGLAGLAMATRAVQLGARRLATGLIWIGLVAPAAVTETKTASQALSNGATPLVIAESAISVLALVVAVAVLRPRMGRITASEGWLLVYLTAAFASTAWSIAPAATFLKAGQLAVSYALLAVLVRSGRPSDVLRQLVAACDVVIVAALIGFVVAHSRAYTATNQWNPTRRLHGLFPAVGPDLLGFLAAVSIVAHLSYRVSRDRANAPIGGSAVILLVDVVTLYLAHTRNALALLVVGLAALYWTYGGRRAQLAARAVMATLLVVASLLLAGGTITHYLSRGQQSSAVSSLTGRTDLWRLAYTDWQSHPATGLGFYAGHRGALLPTQVTQDTSSNIDNLWLETLVDVGLMGFVPLVLAVVVGGRACLRRRSPDMRAVTVALWAMCLGSSFINPSLQFPSYSLMVFGAILLLRPDVGVPASDEGRPLVASRPAVAQDALTGRLTPREG